MCVKADALKNGREDLATTAAPQAGNEAYEKGMTRKLIPKALNRGKPARLSKGILTVPPPTPNMPLMKPAKSPIRR